MDLYEINKCKNIALYIMMCYRRACFSFPCLKNYQQWCSCQEFPLHSYLEISRKSLFRIYFYLKKFLLLCFLYFWIDFYYDHYSFHNIWNNLAEFCFFLYFLLLMRQHFMYEIKLTFRLQCHLILSQKKANIMKNIKRNMQTEIQRYISGLIIFR